LAKPISLFGTAVIALLAVLAAPPAADAAATWTKTGPIPGAFVGGLAYNADGSTLYAGGLGTVFRSTDNGRRWTAAALPAKFASSVVVSIATSPLDKRLVLASTWDVSFPTSFNSQYGPAGDAVFASSDGGLTWRAGNIPNQVESDDSQYPYYVVWDPKTAQTAYASSGGYQGTGAVFRTSSGGRSWSLVYFPGNINQPFPRGPIAAASTTPASLYFAAADFNYSTDGDGYIAKSINRAASLSFVEPLGYVGFPGYGPVLTAFAHDRKAPNTVYALASGYNDGTLVNFEYLQFLWTPNGGINWVPRVSGLPRSVIGTALAVDPASEAVLLPLCCAPHNQLYRSSNEGKTWSDGGVIPVGSASLAVRPGQVLRLPATPPGRAGRC
jgi:photosystem II stability/assembly factor-like uncharacterized protein